MRVLRHARDLSRYAKGAGDILQALRDAKQAGGSLAKALALIRAAGIVADWVSPEDRLRVEMRTWARRMPTGDLVIEFSEDHYSFREDAPLKAHIGAPQPEDLADKLRRRGEERGAIFLVGPTGSGKTMLARHVAHELKCARTIRVPARLVSGEKAPSLLRALHDVFAPCAIVVDDMQEAFDGDRGENNCGYGGDSGAWAAAAEALRHKCLLAITLMNDSARFRQECKRAGGLYVPGMRPGRVGLVVPLPPPGVQNRRAILKHYLGETAPEDMVKVSNGLTPAYLEELARRVRCGDLWKTEVRQLKACAPRLSGGRYDSGIGMMYKHIRDVSGRLNTRMAAIEARLGELPEEVHDV